ncbi:MAG: Arc family DNA-binding protein [Roseateles sp.]
MAETPATADATVPPTSVRLPSELRDRLIKAAARNSRTLSAEIVRRLWESELPQPEKAPAPTGGPRHYVNDQQAAQVVAAQTLSERRLLELFNQLSPERQLALLTLLNA